MANNWHLAMVIYDPDLFPVSSSKSAEQSTADFLEQVLDILIDHVKKSNDRERYIISSILYCFLLADSR